MDPKDRFASSPFAGFTTTGVDEWATIQRQAARWRAIVRFAAPLALGAGFVAFALRFVERYEREDVARARVTSRDIAGNIQEYRRLSGTLPYGLVDMRTPPTGRGWFDEPHVDPWQNQYVLIIVPGQAPGFYVASKGPDGVLMTHDDVGNWFEE